MATEAEPRPLRVDAERNLRRLLDAATEAFAEQGPDVSVAEIARRAGVGKGTVFRRFPTKGHLIAALVATRFEELAATGAQLLEDADAGAAVHAFMRAMVDLQVRDRGFCEAAGEAVGGYDDVAAAHERVRDVARELLTRAQAEGAVRGDVTPDDVLILAWACGHAALPMHEIAPEFWQRQLDLIFDGLRPEGAHPPSQPPLTKAQVAELKAHKRGETGT